MNNRSPEEMYKEADQIKSSMPALYDPSGHYEKEFQRALALYKEAATQGHLPSMYRFAKLSLLNYHPSTNTVEAIAFLIKSAELGHMDAQYEMFLYYKNGLSRFGIEINSEKAHRMACMIDRNSLPYEQAAVLRKYFKELETAVPQQKKFNISAESKEFNCNDPLVQTAASKLTEFLDYTANDTAKLFKFQKQAIKNEIDAKKAIIGAHLAVLSDVKTRKLRK